MASPTPAELQLIKELRSKVSDAIPESEKNDDFYLLRFIRAREHDLQRAEEMLRKSFEWRKEREVEKIRDWIPHEVFQKYYPFGYCGFDTEGCPIMMCPVGRIDIRGLVETVGKEDFNKYTIQVLESTMLKMKVKSKEIGKPVFQMVAIFDCEHLSIKHLTYKATADILLELVRGYEANYPETLKGAYIVNAPKIFTMAFGIIKPLLSKHTMSKIHIFDSNESKWKKCILENIPAHEIPSHWGGTKKGSDQFCSNIICMGGPVPTRYYLKGSTDTDDDDGLICVTLPAGQKLTFEYEILEAGSTLKWNLKSDGYDVGLSITCEDSGEEVVPYKRVDSHLAKVEGSLLCSKPGRYSVSFDNSYSRFRSKGIRYFISVLSPDGILVEEEDVDTDL